MKKSTLLGCLVFFLVVMMMPYESHAVPSYARQVQKPCTACHTVWGNLNQYGRQFKVKAYTDVSEKWEMIKKDNMNMATIAPFSTRVVLEPMVKDNSTGTGSTSDVNQVAIFMASRVFDYAGVFASAEADGFSATSGGGTFTIPTVKVAFQYPLSEGNTIGLVAFGGLAASADPFNSLGGRDRDLSFDDGTPFILNTGWTFNFWSGTNIGEVLHGYFIGNRLYLAAGVMRGGNSADGIAGLSNADNSDPNDMYYRIAWDQKLPNGAVTFGGVVYNGKQRIAGVIDPGPPPVIGNLYDSKVRRSYVDLSLEQNYGEDHIVEVQALFGGGEDKNVFNDDSSRKFSGYYVQADYYYDRTIGVIASLNNIKYKDVELTDPTTNVNGIPTDKIDQWLVGINYMPWLNTKVALQYANAKTTYLDGTDTTNRITRLVLDLLY